MKKLLFVSIIIVSSCSNNINVKNLQGNWYWNYHEKDNNNLAEVIIKNDSIILIDYLNFIKKGVFTIEQDSMIIKLKNEVLRKKIKLIDSSLILNFTSFRKYDEDDHINYSEIDLIDLESERRISAIKLSKYQGSFKLLKINDSIKIKFGDRYCSLEEYIYSVPVHFEKPGHVVLLGNNFSLQELQDVFLEMNYNNILAIRFVTKTDFKDFYYHVFLVKTDIWQAEVNQYIEKKRFEKKGIPNVPEYYSKQRYIKSNNPTLIEIESEKDFIKLDKTKVNTTYLISINSTLSVKEYLLLSQKINKIRKKNKLKIRTELINF